MSRAATLSLMGLYNYDPSIFGLMTWPDGFPDEYHDTFINNLLVESGNLEIMYPDPVFMKNMIGAWSAKQAPVWTKMYKTTTYDYNPIINYDRTEESEDTYNRQGSGTGHADGYEASYDTPVNTDDEGMSKTNKSDTTSSSTEQTANTHKLRAYGNIGVTTTQAMITEERKVSEFNIIDYMIQDFRKRFCILVYD